MTTEELNPHRLHWVALILLVISVCINYIDRGNLGVAAHSIAAELNFKPDRLGILLGSLFWTYSLGQLVAGKIIDRWNVNWAYAVGFFAWSAATALTGLVSSFVAIFLLRLILGAAEAIAYPAYSKIIATTFPERLRGTANALIDAGSKVGPALGTMLGFVIIRAYSWREMFLGIGALSLLWLIPWVIVVPRLPASHYALSGDPSPSYAEIVRKRSLWGTVLGLFGGNYLWYFFLTWLPYYFEHERHYTKNQLALFASLPFWAVAIASMFFGLLADWFIRRGFPAGRVRQTFVSVGLAGCCLFTLPAVLVTEPWASTVLIVLSSICMAAFSSNHWALAQFLSGPEAAGKWTGFENCIGNFAGVVAAYLSGKAVQQTDSFVAAFVLASAASLLGVCGFWLLVGRPQRVHWSSSKQSAPSQVFEPFPTD